MLGKSLGKHCSAKSSSSRQTSHLKLSANYPCFEVDMLGKSLRKHCSAKSSSSRQSSHLNLSANCTKTTTNRVPN